MAVTAHDLKSLSPLNTPQTLGNLALAEPATVATAATAAVPLTAPDAHTPTTATSLADLLAHPALHRLGETIEPAPLGDPTWSRAELAGRLCELSAGQDGALLSAAMAVVHDTQLAGDPVAWISATPATFFPPDAAAGGIDLAALVVVRARDARTAGRAADVLLRSGAYGLVVLDLGTSAAMPTPLQGRLVQLALKHDAAVLCLTDKQPDTASLGSLVSLRGQAARRRVTGGFACRIRTLKDKRRGPGWTWQEVRRGPDGWH